jgi:hypothetical protein
MAVDAAGNVCVTGGFIENRVTALPQGGYSYSTVESWFTRQYLAATGQWSTTDLFSYSTNQNGLSRGVAIAPSGSVFTVGYGTSDSGQRRWVVRKRAAFPPLAQVRALEQKVNDLSAQSAIAGNPASLLLGFLDGIEAKLERGKSPPVCGQLGAFSNKVQEYMKHGTVSPDDGQGLLDGAANLSRLLGCP